MVETRTDPGAAEIIRDTSRPILLIGFLHQGNLGLGYLSAVLRENGYTVVVADIESEKDELVALARSINPMIVGLSLIFQYFVLDYAKIVAHLRKAGLDSHITMGGHFASLSWQETLRLVPGLDSVVRFEGEETLLELADRIGTGREWRDLAGIACHRDGVAVSNPLHHLLPDLDALPYPERNYEPQVILGHRMFPLLASRGCARTCSFCSIHTFYRTAPGKVVRLRRPDLVAEEMLHLHRDRGATLFLFQDDDFPIFGPVWRKWAYRFVDELHARKLPGRILWKMNCRADAVEPELLSAMRDAGLYLVYMGLESGSEDGLATLNKRVTVEQNLGAVAMLKSLGLAYEFGFMLLDPSSTFQSVEDNLRFLETITADGTNAAVFCRMLPYDGTPIKDQLAREGRLRGDVCDPDYDFLDPRLDGFYSDLNRLLKLSGWIHGHDALSPSLNFAWTEMVIMRRLFPPLAGLEDYDRALRRITRAANALLFAIVRAFAAQHQGGPPAGFDAETITRQTRPLLAELVERRTALVEANHETMLRSLDELQLVEA
jgi:radical SAM superfamily enzyme YgiQ (UPF0313 family)